MNKWCAVLVIITISLIYLGMMAAVYRLVWGY